MVAMFPRLPIAERWLRRDRGQHGGLYSLRSDYVAMLRALSAKLRLVDVRVVGQYVVEHPRTRERLPMPAIALADASRTVVIRWDHCREPPSRPWTLSIRCQSPYRGPTLALFDTERDLRESPISGLAPDWLFGPFAANPAEFSCDLEDEWDVMTVLQLVIHGASR